LYPPLPDAELWYGPPVKLCVLPLKPPRRFLRRPPPEDGIADEPDEPEEPEDGIAKEEPEDGIAKEEPEEPEEPKEPEEEPECAAKEPDEPIRDGIASLFNALARSEGLIAGGTDAMLILCLCITL